MIILLKGYTKFNADNFHCLITCNYSCLYSFDAFSPLKALSALWRSQNILSTEYHKSIPAQYISLIPGSIRFNANAQTTILLFQLKSLLEPWVYGTLNDVTRCNDKKVKTGRFFEITQQWYRFSSSYISAKQLSFSLTSRMKEMIMWRFRLDCLILLLKNKQRSLWMHIRATVGKNIETSWGGV